MESIIFAGAVTFLLMGMMVGVLFPVLGNMSFLIVVPSLLSVAGLPPAAAVPVGLTHLAALLVPPAVNHWQAGNVDVKLLLLFSLGLLPGLLISEPLCRLMDNSGWWVAVIMGVYLMLLAGAVIHRIRPLPLLPRPNNRWRKMLVNFLHRLPGRVFLPTSMMAVPLLFPVILGVLFAVVGKIWGPAAVLLVCPCLIVCLNMPVITAAGNAMAANFIGLLAVSLGSGFLSLPINIQILLWLFLGSSLTVLILSVFWQRKLYPVPVAVILVLITSVTLWILTAGQSGLHILIQHGSFLSNQFGWFGGVQG
ncbi:TSUP family transporter [Desulforamulus hydrothermalis]|nr:TSUP family transporter [Desulforamulus hydrothermalis]SHH17541.1 hypothetical protein SAMN02745177_01713 [Desulforamulus hydrothermalis Lam5 = DSM 18033]